LDIHRFYTIFAACMNQERKMKNGRLVFTLLLLIAATTVKAQRIGGGLMVGPAFSNMHLSGNDTTMFRPDFTGGVRIALIPEHFIFGAELDVIYSRQGMRTKKGYDLSGNTIRYMHKSHYINIPLLLNVYFRRWNEDDEDESKLVRLRVGPQIGFCLGGSDIIDIKGKKKQQYIAPWEPGTFNRIDYGVTAAVSYWYIEVRYTYGIANVAKNGEKSSNHVISVTWSDIW